MKINFRRAALTVITAAGLSVAYSTVVDAAPLTPSIAVKFASERADGPPADPSDGDLSQVNGPAGVFGTAVWNNLTGPNQAVPQLLNADVAGVSTPAGATVTWSSNGTWSSTGAGGGEELNNAAVGDNRDLMAGYLDTGGVGEVPVSITFASLPQVAPAFDVYVYIQGGVIGRGGTYTIGGTTLEHNVTAAFDANGTFLEDTLEPGTTPNSNYLVFRGLTGTGFTLIGTPTVGNPARAPINAVEIVAVPEPSTLALLGLGVITVGGLAWRRRRES